MLRLPFALAFAAALAVAWLLAFAARAAQEPAKATPTPAPTEASSVRIRTPLDEDEDDEPEPSEDPKALGHRGQFGLRVGFLFGYQMSFRYERSPLCTSFDSDKAVDDQQKVCGFGAGPAMEIALSFAPLGAIEPYAFARLGLASEKNTDTDPLKMLGAGARIYTMADSRLKLFLEPAAGVSIEGSAGNPRWSPAGLNPEYKTDLIFHLGIGPQYDFARYVGVFASGNIDVGILRALTATLNLHVGVQARFP